MKKISIIVPVHNDDKYIGKTLTSLIKQTYTNLQIIVVNDHSTDQSLKIIEHFKNKDKRIEIYSNSLIPGVSNSRNIGLKVATGSYVCFVDGDDNVDPNYVKVLYDNMQDRGLSMITFILTNESDRIEYQKDFNKYFCGSHGEYISLDVKKLLNITIRFTKLINGSVNTKMFDLALINENKISFSSDIAVGEDFLFCIQYYIHMNNVAIYSMKEGYKYTTNPQSIMRSKNKQSTFNMKWMTEIKAMESSIGLLSSTALKREKGLLRSREALAAASLFKIIMLKSKYSEFIKEKSLLKYTFFKNFFYFLCTDLVTVKTKLLFTIIILFPPFIFIQKILNEVRYG